MTLEVLVYVYMCGVMASFTGASVLTVWGLTITNRLLINRRICAHQYDVMRVHDLMFFFRCTGWIVVLMTMILSAVVIFYNQMRLPHARPFLLLTWGVSILICLLCNGVTTAFTALEGTDLGGEHCDEQENPPQ